LQVSHAFHSPLMEPILSEFEAIAAGVRTSAPEIPIVSNVTGELAGADETFDGDYWRRHAREPVQFEAGMSALSKLEIAAFLEVGPSPVLLGMGQLCLPDHKGSWLPSLR